MRYYDRSGKPLDLLEWGQQLQDPHYKRVKVTKLWWGGIVSTVWLGLDHQWQPGGPPLIFETMVFTWNGGDMGFQDRYTTCEHAEREHEEIVKRYQHPKYLMSAIRQSWDRSRLIRRWRRKGWGA